MISPKLVTQEQYQHRYRANIKRLTLKHSADSNLPDQSRKPDRRSNRGIRHLGNQREVGRRHAIPHCPVRSQPHTPNRRGALLTPWPRHTTC